MTKDRGAETFDGIVELVDIAPTGSGVLNGLTFAVKDMFDLPGRVSGFGNPDWKRTHEPATGTAPAVARLLEAGAHLVAITCADELACSLDGINMHFGTPINPQAPERIPGGSSSGSASLVAAGRVDFALGTDTAGSVRVPASYCGIYGFRPTHGAISSQGVLPLGPSFDVVGILARSLDMIKKVAAVLIDEKQGLMPQKLIIPRDFQEPLDDQIAPYLMAHLEAVQSQFAFVRESDLYRQGELTYDMFRAIRAYEAWSIHGAWFDSVKPDMAPSIADRLSQCRLVSEDEFQSAKRAGAKLSKRMGEVIGPDSVICIPTTRALPPMKGASEDELQDNRNRNLCLTSISSFFGLPQISIPVQAGPMKTGLSFMGSKGSDLALLELPSIACSKYQVVEANR